MSASSNSNIAIIEISAGKNKGVNPLNKSTRRHLYTSLQSAFTNASITAIVLTGGFKSKHFSAGADINEFDASENSISDEKDVPSLTSLCDLIEKSSKPIVSAIRGVALGGGFELALSSHYRISDYSAKFGLPEVNIGLIPGAGGTQRLPRLIGVQKACSIITSGRMMGVKEALASGILDATIVDKRESVEDCAVRWAQYASSLGGGSTTSRQLRCMKVKGNDVENHKVCDAFAKKLPPNHKGGEALHSAISAIRASFTKSNFEDGMAVEEELFWDLLLNSAQGRGLRHAFFADRLARRSSSDGNSSVSKLPPRIQSLLQKKEGAIAVIGAGTMGSGIALSFLRAQYSPVYLVDNNEKGLQRGTNLIKSLLQADVSKKRMTKEKAEKISNSLIPTTNMADLSSCVLVVEAVFENLSLKQSIFAKLSNIVAEDTLLLSNTSTLDLDAIASSIPADKNRGRIAGMHFFSPAHVMKLVEIVTSAYSAPETIEAIQIITQLIKKVGVVVGNCNGFVGNRMMGNYTSEMVFLLEEDLVAGGVEEVDGALMRFGMSLGPFIVSDLAGNDIGYLIRTEKGLVRDPKSGVVGPNRPERYTELADELVSKYGRVGQKALKGWYDYDRKIGKGRKPIASPEVAQLIAKYASEFKKKNIGASSQKRLVKEEIVHRILFPLVNEGFKILEENIARRPSDIDVIYLYGYGWPNWRGGPMYWADNEVGLPNMLRTLEDLHRRYPTEDYFVPSKLLRECVDLGVGVGEYYKRGLHKKSGKEGKAVQSKL